MWSYLRCCIARLSTEIGPKELLYDIACFFRAKLHCTDLASLYVELPQVLHCEAQHRNWTEGVTVRYSMFLSRETTLHGLGKLICGATSGVALRGSAQKLDRRSYCTI